MSIQVTDLLKTFAGGSVRAVDEINFSVPSGSVLTLLGPSGCGKTTTMRMIAGLEKPDGGSITIGDRVVYSVPQRINLRPNQRKVGMVFQSYAIWPHMTVFDNVAYPLKGNVDKATLQERSMRALELVGLDHLASRRAPNLSGGQQQRVALARALVAQPEVLLLDEPLSNLDAKLRDQMRKEIRELQQSLGITTLYVTHDQSEALAISDYVAVMSAGHIVDFGEPERIYSRPASRAVADFIGMANVVELTGLRAEGGLWTGTSSMGPIAIEQAGRPPETCGVLIRLEDLHFVAESDAGRPNVWPGRVVSAIYLGSFWECEIEVNGQRLRTHVPRRQRPQEGQTVYVEVPPDRLYLLPEDERGPVTGIGGDDDDAVAEKSA